MSRRDFVKSRVAVAVGAAFAVAYAAAGTVTFTEETGVFRNPGQGWSTMGGKGSFDQTDPVVNIGSVYCRYTWAQLEPEEGRYDWERLEDLLDFAASKGLPASFRVMCASRHDGTGWPTPEWVFNKGAKDDPVHYPLLRKIDLYAGARFVPLAADVRREGSRLSVELSGVNKGVARIHLPYVAQIVVTDAAGREVTVHDAAADPGTWMPGPFRLVDAFDLPPERQGELKLALRLRHRYGIFRNFRFADRETLPDGSLPLGSAK